ncbi:Ribosomal RNA-processing protein 14 [Zancudomyces culisetae]|uniref:Ribosomal RNA-processing protein 14 n=1 Tax=Zancudomyces culisetae TaxID=1213189 RepID=A0A1R1PTU0_ZANCU|nr:Ribosomal RNA-processing protein 14 [Zancudomyces culisetae]|eukprot:OMH84378.1 Ribosomal RNA-processing protein 14 [Zancudomyces culisetae]
MKNTNKKVAENPKFSNKRKLSQVELGRHLTTSEVFEENASKKLKMTLDLDLDGSENTEQIQENENEEEEEKEKEKEQKQTQENSNASIEQIRERLRLRILEYQNKRNKPQVNGSDPNSVAAEKLKKEKRSKDKNKQKVKQRKSEKIPLLVEDTSDKNADRGGLEYSNIKLNGKTKTKQSYHNSNSISNKKTKKDSKLNDAQILARLLAEKHQQQGEMNGKAKLNGKSQNNSDSTVQVSAEDTQQWEVATKRAKGLVVKDDVKKLKQSIKRKQKRKEKSKREWEKRNETVQNSIKEKQAKRIENLNNRGSSNASGKQTGGHAKGKKQTNSSSFSQKSRPSRPGFEGKKTPF